MRPTSTINSGDSHAAARTERRAALTAKARRNAWVLAAVAIAFYLGFIAWNFLRGSLG